jgi:YVTN family beta-propeller protein
VSFRGGEVKYRILGPLEVSDEGGPVTIAPGKQSTLLALLLLHANEVVSVERLIDELWGEAPPAGAAKSIQVQVSRLRKVLRARSGSVGATRAPGVLLTRTGGYALGVEPGELDLHEFERRMASGQRALDEGDAGKAEELLSSALGLWRGPALADVEFGSFGRHEVERLHEIRLHAQELLIEARLARGRHANVVGELEPLIAQHPLREHLRYLLMLALYRAGRQAEALEAYRQTRLVLVDELGIDPGPAIRDLEQAILRQDPALDLKPDRPSEAVAETEPARADAGRPPRRQGGLRPMWLLGAAAIAGVVAIVLLFAGNDDDAGLGAEPDSVAVIDIASNELVDRVPVGVDPTSVSAGEGFLWVANTGDDTVSQIDGRTRQVGATIAPGVAVDAMAAGEGAVWTSDNRRGVLARIDPALRTVDRSIRISGRNRFFNRPTPLATGSGSVWAVTPGSSVVRITPPRKVEGETPVGGNPRGIAVGEGGVWVSDYLDRTITRIDPVTGGAVATIPVGRGAAGVAAGGGYVWVANSLDGTVAQIDPATDSVRNTIPVGGAPSGVAFGAGAVWVANSGNGTVARIDPETAEVAATIDVGESPQGLAVLDDTVWVSVQAAAEEPAGVASEGVVRLALTRGGRAESQAQPADPALALPGPVTYATAALLLNYPDRPFPAGARLRPEVAAAAPEVSNGGRTYTYEIREGFRFSPPSGQPVTAEAFEHAIERALDPRIASYAATLVGDIAGARAFQAGRTSDLAGVVVRGDELSITLEAPSPTLPARLATPYFAAVPPNIPTDPEGVEGIPSAGPYYVAHVGNDGGSVLRRNPNYGGERPAMIETIEIVPEADRPDLGDVDEGTLDGLVTTLDEQEEADLVEEHGPESEAADEGDQRFFSFPTQFASYLVFNTQRRPLASADVRRAVNFAIDREALAETPNQAITGQPTDQYIPPGMLGFEDAEVYPLEAPEQATAKRLADGGGRAVLYTCTEPTCAERAEVVRANLAAIGIELEVRRFSFAELYGERLPRPGEPWDIADTSWVADYSDPFGVLNVLFGEGSPIGFGGFDAPPFQAALARAATLTGPARYRAYARLDAELALEDPPAAAYAIATNDYFFAPRIGCQLNQPVYGLDLAALCVED